MPAMPPRANGDPAARSEKRKSHSAHSPVESVPGVRWQDLSICPPTAPACILQCQSDHEHLPLLGKKTAHIGELAWQVFINHVV